MKMADHELDKVSKQLSDGVGVQDPDDAELDDLDKDAGGDAATDAQEFEGTLQDPASSFAQTGQLVMSPPSPAEKQKLADLRQKFGDQIEAMKPMKELRHLKREEGDVLQQLRSAGQHSVDSTREFTAKMKGLLGPNPSSLLETTESPEEAAIDAVPMPSDPKDKKAWKAYRDKASVADNKALDGEIWDDYEKKHPPKPDTSEDDIDPGAVMEAKAAEINIHERDLEIKARDAYDSLNKDAKNVPDFEAIMLPNEMQQRADRLERAEASSLAQKAELPTQDEIFRNKMADLQRQESLATQNAQAILGGMSKQVEEKATEKPRVPYDPILVHDAALFQNAIDEAPMVNKLEALNDSGALNDMEPPAEAEDPFLSFSQSTYDATDQDQDKLPFQGLSSMDAASYASLLQRGADANLRTGRAGGH